MNSLLSGHFSLEISGFCHFLITFLLKSLLFDNFPIWSLYFLVFKSLLSLHYSTKISSFYPFLTTFLLKSLLPVTFSDHFPFEIFTFWYVSHWNLYFRITFLLKFALPDHLSIEISTFSSLSYWNLFFLSLSDHFPIWNLYFLVFKSLLSHFSIEISTFCHFLTTFLLESLLSVTFWSLFYWNLYLLNTFLLKSLLSDLSFITFLNNEISTSCHLISDHRRTGNPQHALTVRHNFCVGKHRISCTHASTWHASPALWLH